MNCHDLETVAGDLARGHMIEAALREHALSHAASCDCCARRLADEQALTAGLRGIASKDETDEAPARVEASLLAAFREQHTALPSAAFAGAPAASRRWLYIAAGVAAAAVFVMLLSLIVSREPQQPAPQKVESNTPSAPSEERPAAPQSPVLPVSPKRKLAIKRADRPVREATTNTARQNRRANDIAESSGETEIATDFFPLVNRESLAQLDSGQIMRVELPRSALMSFGLPMNMERAHERIKADVVVGNDGLARAIRFVR